MKVVGQIERFKIVARTSAYGSVVLAGTPLLR